MMKIGAKTHRRFPYESSLTNVQYSIIVKAKNLAKKIFFLISFSSATLEFNKR